MSNLTFQEQLEALRPELVVPKKGVKIEDKINNIINTNEKIHSNDFKSKGVTMINKPIYNSEIKKPQRREIWMVNFGQRKGSLQSGIRPCIISSNPVNNQFASIRNVFPITSKINKKLPVHVELDESCGLKEKSLVLTEQITTIDIRYDLLYYIGVVDEVSMRRIDRARDIQLGELIEKNALEKLSDESREYIINKIRFIEKCKSSIEVYKEIKGDAVSIELAKDRIFEEENSLQHYCYKKNIDYNEVCNNYFELTKRKEENIAL